jgi:hypothetical protein
MEKTVNKSKDLTNRFNKLAYCAFIVLGIYFFIRGDISNAAINLGIALVFDPFDNRIKWSERKLYQKAISLTHLIIVFVTFAWMLLK